MRNSKREPERNCCFSFLFWRTRTWLLVRCPLTGSPIACLLPRFVPVSFNLAMSPKIWRRSSFSIFMFVKAALISRIWLCFSSPTRHVSWRWFLARRREETCGPMPKKVWSAACCFCLSFSRKTLEVMIFLWHVLDWIAVRPRDSQSLKARRVRKAGLGGPSYLDESALREVNIE